MLLTLKTVCTPCPYTPMFNFLSDVLVIAFMHSIANNNNNIPAGLVLTIDVVIIL